MHTLALHDALPSFRGGRSGRERAAARLDREISEEDRGEEELALRRGERRFGAVGGKGVERGDLEERLHDQHEEVEVKRGGGADRIDGRGAAGEPAAVIGSEGECEDQRREDAGGECRGEGKDRKEEAGEGRSEEHTSELQSLRSNS